MFMYLFDWELLFGCMWETVEILISSIHMFCFYVPDQTSLAQNSLYMIRSRHTLLSILTPQGGRAVGLIPKKSPQKSRLAATTLPR